MKQAATSIAAGARKTGNKKLFKTGKQKRGRRNAASYCFGPVFCHALGGEQGARRPGDSAILIYFRIQE